MRTDFSLPASLKELADKRYGEWCDALTSEESFDEDKARLVLASSDYISRWAVKKPEWLLDAINGVSIEQGLSQLQDTFDLRVSEFDMKQKLRLERHYWSILIAVNDMFQLADIKAITFYQSTLADILIQAAYRWAEHHHHKQYGKPYGASGDVQQMLILAMGKLGGRELNFSSDIDLIFAYPEEGETDRQSKPVENQKFFIRLGQKLISLLSDVTYDGFVYRVDMRLRPYGQSGALVTNFNALQDY